MTMLAKSVETGVITREGCEARIALYDAWKKAGHQPKELLAETNAIKCFYGADRVERRHGELGYVWTPSGQFADLVSAFEEGYKWTAA